MAFKTATREKAKLRLAIDGPAGSGKTYTALRIARRLAGPSGTVAVLDTERRSAAKYAGGKPFHFDTDEPKTFSPRDYITSIKEAADVGYDVLVIDSLSHAWSGAGGALEIVDSHKDKFGGGWRAVTPMHNALVDAILTAPMHVIVTMRSKMEYVIDEKTKKISKVGLKPVQREGMEYEFDVVIDMNDLHVGTVSKSRCSEVADRSYPTPGEDLADTLLEWLNDGTTPVAAPPKFVPAVQPAPAPMSTEDTAAAAQAVADAAMTEAAEDETFREDYAAATTPAAVNAIGLRIQALKLPKGSPRRTRLGALHIAASTRVAPVIEVGAAE
jgi:AAA domain